MANVKITALTGISSADVTDEDVFVVVDLSADETKKITLANVIAAVDTDTNEVSNVVALQAGLEGANSNQVAIATFADDTGTWQAGNLIPKANGVYSLGAADALWKDVFISAGSIKLGSVTISAADDEGITIAGASGDTTSIVTPTAGGASNVSANIALLESNIEILLGSSAGQNTRISAEEANVINLQTGLAGANVALTNEISATNTDVTNLVSGIGGSNSRIAAEEANVIALQSGISGSNSRIVAEEANVIALQAGLTGANTNISSNDTDITNLVTGLDGANTVIATKAATTYVDAQIAAIVDSAPETLDTLNELAAALGDDANFATTTATQIGTISSNTVNLQTGIAGSNTNITANETRRAANTSIFLGAFTGSNARIAAEEANVIALQAGIAGANTNIASNDTDITNLVTGLDGSNTNITALEARRTANTLIFEGAFTGSNTRIAAEEANVIALQGGIAGANTNIASNDTDITNLVTGLEGANTTISTNESTRSSNAAQLAAGIAGIDASGDADAVEVRRASNTSIFLGAHSGANTRIAAEEANVIALQGGIAGANTNISNNDTDITNLVTGLGGSNTNITAVEARRAANIAGAVSSITTSDLTASRAVVSDGSGKIDVSAVTATELGYLDGVTSAIQTQLDGKVNTTGDNIITSTTAGSAAAPEFELFRDITGADANYIGQIKFSADNDANSKTVFAKITGKIGDASSGSEDGIIEIAHQKAGSQNINMRMSSTKYSILNGTDFDINTHDGSSTGLQLGGTLVTATAAELNILDGVTATTAELNYTDGVTSNIQTQLDGKQDSGSYLTGNETITLSGDVSGSGTTAITVTIADDSHNHVISNIDDLQTSLDAKDTVANVYATYLVAKGGIDGANTNITALEARRTANIAGAISSVLTSDLTASRALQSGSGGKIEVSAVTATELGYLDGVTSAIQTQLDGKQASGSYLTGNETITLSGDVSGSGTTSITVTIADDSHNHVISNIDNLQTSLDAKDTVANVYATYLVAKGGIDGANTNIASNDTDITNLITGLQGANTSISNISSGGSAFTGEVTMGDDLIVTGNLTVNGTTVTASTTNTVIEDNLIELNNGAASNGNDSGIVIERGSTGDNAFMGWDESADKFIVGTTTATGASTGNLTITAAPLETGDLGVTGNITVSGTVDGRDIATDGTKLDGIESGATADQSASEILTAIKTVDGAGSGLDADLLDGQSSAYYAVEATRSSNAAQLAAGIASAGGTMTAAEIRALGFFDTSNDGAGSGLDADLLDGVSSGSFLRSDATDSASGNLTFSGTVNVSGTLQIGGASITSTAAELNILDGVTSTAAELNILDGVTATTAELNYVDGVTSAIQTQLNAKQGTLTAGDNITLLAGVDLDTSTYDTKTADVSEEYNYESLMFSPDGTKIILFSWQNDILRQHTLSTAWDVSTHTYNSGTNFSVSSQTSSGNHACLSRDGKHILVQQVNSVIYQYTFSSTNTADGGLGNLAYASKTHTLPNGSGEAFETTTARAIDWLDNGNAIAVGGSDDKIYKYTMSTPYDISTISNASETVSPALTASFTPFDIRSMQFSDDGTSVYVGQYNYSQSGDSHITEHLMSTAYDVTTITSLADEELDTPTVSGATNMNAMTGFYIEEAESKLYALTVLDDKVHQFSMGGGSGTTISADATGFATVTSTEYTTGTYNSYAIGTTVSSVNNVFVSINGVSQRPTEYVLGASGANVQFKDASLASGLDLELRTIS